MCTSPLSQPGWQLSEIRGCHRAQVKLTSEEQTVHAKSVESEHLEAIMRKAERKYSTIEDRREDELVHMRNSKMDKLEDAHRLAHRESLKVCINLAPCILPLYSLSFCPFPSSTSSPVHSSPLSNSFPLPFGRVTPCPFVSLVPHLCPQPLCHALFLRSLLSPCLQGHPNSLRLSNREDT